jgi:hypothetical protein
MPLGDVECGQTLSRIVQAPKKAQRLIVQALQA